MCSVELLCIVCYLPSLVCSVEPVVCYLPSLVCSVELLCVVCYLPSLMCSVEPVVCYLPSLVCSVELLCVVCYLPSLMCSVEPVVCCVLFTISCVQGTDDSVRSCFIKFALSFLVIGGDHVIRAILELKGM